MLRKKIINFKTNGSICRSPVFRVGLLLLLTWLTTIPVSMGQYYVGVFYNSYNQSLITTSNLKFKSFTDAQDCMSQFIQKNLYEKQFYFTIQGPYISEIVAASQRDGIRALLNQNGYTVKDIQPTLDRSPVTMKLVARPIAFSRLPTVNASSESATSFDKKLVIGYLQTAAPRIKIRVYTLTETGDKGPLIYEDWLMKGGLVRIVTKTGRIVYNYKNTDVDTYNGNFFIDCRGTIEQASQIP